jgi:uncharacterized protein YodC (DUF2158 family)
MYNIGDIVQLKSGGPKMTIQRIIGDYQENDRLKMADNLIKISGYKDGDLICQWFNDNKLETGMFNAEMITKLE